MVIRCVIRGCKTEGKSGFRSFPTNAVTAEKWVEDSIKTSCLLDRIRQKKLARSFLKICSKHFKESDYETNPNGEKRLLKGVCPTLLLPNVLRIHYEHNYTPVHQCKESFL